MIDGANQVGEGATQVFCTYVIVDVGHESRVKHVLNFSVVS